MAVTTPPVERSAGPSRQGLIERSWELEALQQCFDAARAGTGARVYIEAASGLGKSRLIGAALEMASAQGFTVLSAAASRLEQEFPLAVITQLLETPWLALSASDREALLDGRGRQAAELFADGAVIPPAGDVAYPLIHALSWVLRNMASPLAGPFGARPLAILVDDLHNSDGPSVRVLAYLCERIAELPIAVVVAATPGAPGADRQVMTGLKRDGGALLRPAALSPEGAGVLVRRTFPRADCEFCTACHEVSGGNPFVLSELLRQLRADERPPQASAAELAGVVVDGVVASVAARIEAMTPAAHEVLKATAVLTGGASLRQVAALTGLREDELLRAADALAAEGLLSPGAPLCFAQPLLAGAVYASLPPLERARAHQRAAAVLADEDAPAEQIIAHLFSASPGESQRAIETLRAAAADAMRFHRPERAIELLERALSEGPGDGERAELLAELGRAEAKAGRPGAAERLKGAMTISDDPERRAHLALDLGQMLYLQGSYEEAAAVLEAGLGDVENGDGPLPRDLLAAYVSAASLVGRLQPRALELRDRVLADLADGPSRLQRVAIAHTAVHDSLAGVPRQTVRELCDLAWGAGVLLEADVEEELGLPLLSTALVIADELERVVEISDSVLAAGRGGASPTGGYGAASWSRSWALFEQGRIAEAEADANAAIDACGADDGGGGYLLTARAVIARCHIERGHNDQAEVMLAALEAGGFCESDFFPMMLLIRAQLHLEEHRPADAVQDALQAGALATSSFGEISPGALPWRSTAALGYIALGEPDRARELAGAELESARRIDLGRVVIRDLRVMGMAARGHQGIELLTLAVKLGDALPPRLEQIRALVDLGAALRRANRRVDAREPLRRGLDLSHRSGAGVLAARARTELLATGARPRRLAQTGVDSLTVSQRRVAELAARGLTTRQIAEALFVTPKTVEYHLRQTYLKLDVGSRTELTAALHEL